jgi:hypothetical protein
VLELAPIEVGPDQGVPATQRVHSCGCRLTIGFLGLFSFLGIPGSGSDAYST